LKWKRKIVANETSERKLLDVGCGTGNFLEHMKNHGWQTTGIEPSESAAAKSREKKIGVIHKSIYELGEQKFDVITLWHVLEHLHEPQQKLETLKNHLTENGTIIIAVPNRESYDAKHYKNHWAAFDVPRHLWHFSQQNMRSILNQTGLRLTNTLPMVLDSFYVSLLSESYRNPKRNKISNIIAAFFMGFSSNLKARKTKNYSSLIYIAKK
jgi:2-polyprenyl-3-methyl-5-hydroxy-6-metoxy-1,4-benzoquinol methylase